MDWIFRNVRALIQVGLAVACAALIVLWPEWRMVLHALDYDEELTCTTPTEIMCTESLVETTSCSESQVNMCIGEDEMIDTSPSAALPVTSSASSPITRDEYATMAGTLAMGGGLVGAGGAALVAVGTCTVLPIVCLGIVLTSGAMFGGATGMGIIAASSSPLTVIPDSNFMVVDVPRIARIPVLEQDGGGEVDAFNAFFTNQATVFATQRAISTSLARAQGAFNADRGFWQIKQLQTAEQYSRELANLLVEQTNLLNRLHAELVAAGISVNITSADMLGFQERVALDGLPGELVDALTEFGADQTMIDQVAELIIGQDFSGVSGNFPDILVSSELVSALHDLSAALSAISVRIDIKPGDSNIINISRDPNRPEVIPVAVLTTPSFNATTVDPTTVQFGKTGTEAAPVQAALEDADGDGALDLVLDFHTQDTGLQCGDTFAALAGQTVSGQVIHGFNTIVTVRGGAICQ